MGLLVLRGCEEPAAGACAVCGTPLCMMHQVMGAQGPSCPECASSPEATERNEYYNTYGKPGEHAQFGDKKYFSPEDAAAARSAQQKRTYDPHES
jgi:hypothetical protein